MRFNERLNAAIRDRSSMLCVGLDPDPARIGGRDVARYLTDVIEATAAFAVAYKANLAFFEQLGAAGHDVLRRTLAAIPAGSLLIGDAKRGDIGNTAEAYARALFDGLGFDAVTANPYGGGDSVAPFLAREERGCFVWCRSSNPGGADLQALEVNAGSETKRLYEVVAGLAVGWNSRGNVGLVVGATYPAELARVRSIAPEIPILVPGVGAQGGDLDAAVQAAKDVHGAGFLVASSRGVLYASGGDDYAAAAGEAAQRLRDAINAALKN
jgi:orotidine-5'-phosphate decarboxylase